MEFGNPEKCGSLQTQSTGLAGMCNFPIAGTTCVAEVMTTLLLCGVRNECIHYEFSLTVMDRSIVWTSIQIAITLWEVGSEDRYVRVWDVLTGTCVRTFCGHSAGVTAVKFSPCGRYIISTARDGAVCVWDVAYQRLAGMETKEFRGSMGSICFSRDGGSFAVSQGGESLSIYSLDNMVAATSNVTANNELCFDPK
ncbi:unnamed protein product [Cylicostephanus goldi]|uniref:Uncharacterized protein n=1 Tax=Cylicostephanus goldi TaxID=71465 RepID=A0A3P7QED1_CYLGO|nr:unnamed protein product [Cylicostephanus goldi]